MFHLYDPSKLSQMACHTRLHYIYCTGIINIIITILSAAAAALQVGVYRIVALDYLAEYE